MSVHSFVALGSCFMLIFGFSTGLRENATNVVTRTTYSRVRYTANCGTWGWRRCTRYRRGSSKTFHCRTGYRSTDNIGCPHVCTAISNCDLETCTSSSNQVCSRCDGVVSEQAGHRAYVASPTRKSCIQACSWRSDSTWCYPGTCRNEYASNCVCSSGFTGKHCQTITAKPTINSNLLRLTASNGDVAEAPPNISSGPSQSTSWSNINSPSSIYYKFTAEYRTAPPARHAFVERFTVGIVGGNTSLKLRGQIASFPCGGVSSSSPNTGPYTCELSRSWSSVLHVPLPLQHRDVIEISNMATNGGYVKIRNKERNTLATHYYIGAAQSHTFTMTIDLVAPYHCTGSTACVVSMLSAPNVITAPTVNLRWSGWVDDDAGVDHFVREVYELHAVGDELRDKRLVDTKTVNRSKETDIFVLPSVGVYSVVLSAFDKAGNHRSARRILIYDGKSTVTTQDKKELRVTTASAATSEWQTTSSAVTVDWTNRYINTVHHNNKWLHGVASSGGVGSDYDDNEGDRSVAATKNVQGITSFRTSYKIDHKGGSFLTRLPADHVFTKQGLSQSQTITPSLVDGDTVRFWVRAYDIKSDVKEEHVTVHIDTSPPVIEYLWLSRNDSLNISVYRVEELNDVIMEWDMSDEHSGVEMVEWRIVEKRQDEEIVLAVHDISIQSHRTMDDCNTMYDTRDGNCYCTHDGRCYHPHFHVKPSRDDIREVRSADGKKYCFEVTVTNHAKLKTEQEVKITMDASPPHSGIVHDGQSGHPEVDYQDSLQLHAHWDGFVDKESAIAFYQYTFGPRCLQGDLFDLNKTKNMESTHSTEVTWTAPSCGKFYVTVVAYNRAQQRSDAVCSDGVETCKANPVVGKTLVPIVSGTVSAVVAGAAIIIGVVVWKRKQRRQPEKTDQTVYYNIRLPTRVKPKQIKPRANRSQPEASCRTYDTLDFNAGADEEAYGSIQIRGSGETSIYEPIESPIYVNCGGTSRFTPRVTFNST
ncbi:uncharacterized protein [Haliotis cracherodii]|uniref:uncharacterized protein n=1 Tax=Haliotis cracherodii TaxID=6455 RepID=UPI0039EBA2A3